MKSKSYLVIAVLLSIFTGGGMYAYYAMQGSISIRDIIMAVVLLLVVAFALFLGANRFRSEKRGEPAEDELSRLILLKAAATSFYLSLYLWLVLIFINSSREMDTESAIGAGIIGMSFLFAISWFYHRSRELRNS
jgi:hypothetical protein